MTSPLTVELRYLRTRSPIPTSIIDTIILPMIGVNEKYKSYMQEIVLAPIADSYRES
jgi:hypothetical protein